MKLKATLGLAALLALLAASPSPLRAQEVSYDAAGMQVAGTAVTNATGTIAQLNYGPNGTVEGFLLSGSTILLEFPSNVTGGINTLGAAGNSVTYSGTAVTSSTGFQTVRVTSFTNNTTKATYSAPTAGTGTPSTATTYGPTSGTVRQLNYDDNGNIDGFLFLPSGSSTPVFVSTGGQGSATLKTLLTVGATVSVTGTSRAAASTATVPTLTVVTPSSITVGGQTIVLATGPGGGSNRGPGGPGGRH